MAACRSLRHLVLGIASLTAGVVAQQAPPDPIALLLDADRQFLAGARDEALVLVARAEELAAGASGAVQREAFAGTVQDLRVRIDPLWTRRDELRTLAAKDLLDLGRAYLRRKLLLRAESVLDQAVALGDRTAPEVVAYARKQLAARPDSVSTTTKPAKPGGPQDLIGKVRTKVANGSWDLRNTEIRSPTLSGKTAYLIASEPRHTNDRLSIDILIGDVDGTAGLLFGAIDMFTYYLVELRHVTAEGVRESVLRVFQVTNAEASLIGEAFVDLTGEQRAEWVTVTATIRERDVIAGIGAARNLRVTCPTLPHGGVGFFVSGNSPKIEPSIYRRLLIQPAPKEPESRAAEQPSPADDPAAAVIRTALDVPLDQQDLDARLLALHAVAARLPDVVDDSTRTALAARLRESLDKLDPLARMAGDARRARAERLAELARAYVTAELPRTALIVLGEASRHEPEAGAALRAELLARLAPPPPIPVPLAELCDFLTVFEGGEVLYGNAGWTLRESMATAPAGPDSASVFAGKHRQPAAASVRVDVVLPAGADARGGIAFDVRSSHDLAFAIVGRREGRAFVRVHRYYGGNWTILGEVLGASMPQDDDACAPLELLFDGPRLRVTTAGATAPIECTLAERAAMPRLGLFASTNGPPATFRNFKVVNRP
ncbi:MAG: hypothetical protein HZB39_16845 [Planctomycetes bacterium]|nr:hypothetical protein [Planctomycetota bacterium]